MMPCPSGGTGQTRRLPDLPIQLLHFFGSSAEAVCQRFHAPPPAQVVEPWAGSYLDEKLSVSERSNYAMREEMLALKRELGPSGPTALVTHGANPGLVSHLVKQGLLNIAHDSGLDDVAEPTSRREWAALAHRLGIKVIHIAERDSQTTRESKAREGRGEAPHTPLFLSLGAFA